MPNKYLVKIAEFSDEDKQELMHTGVIAGLGTGMGMAANAALRARYGTSVPKAVEMISLGGSGLLADYIAVKANKHVGNPTPQPKINTP